MIKFKKSNTTRLFFVLLMLSEMNGFVIEAREKRSEPSLGFLLANRSLRGGASETLSKGALQAIGELTTPFIQIGQDHFLNLLGPTVWYRATAAPKNSKRVSDLIFNENVEEEVEDYQHQLLYAAASDSEMPPLLLYGPAGTGKTELAKRLTNEGSEYGVNLVVVEIHTQDLKKSKQVRTWFDIPGSNGGQNRNKFEHLLQFANRPYKKFLGQWLGRSKKKLIIFIDEGERLLAPDSSGQRTDEIEAFLSAMGSGSPHFTIILTTNNPGQIDEAVLSRFAYQIHVDSPDDEKRLEIIEKYIVSRIRTNETFSAIKISPSFLKDPQMQAKFFEASKGLAGRDLKQIAFASVNKAYRNLRQSQSQEDQDPDLAGTITTQIIVDKVIERKAKKSEQDKLAEIEEKKRLERFEQELKVGIIRKLKEQELVEKTRSEIIEESKGTSKSKTLKQRQENSEDDDDDDEQD